MQLMNSAQQEAAGGRLWLDLAERNDPNPKSGVAGIMFVTSTVEVIDNPLNK
jgi:hypothetical protein